MPASTASVALRARPGWARGVALAATFALSLLQAPYWLLMAFALAIVLLTSFA